MGIILCAVVLVFHCIPELFSLLIIYGVNDTDSINRKSNMLIFICSSFVNGVCFLLAQRCILIRWNFLKTLKEILELDITYRYLEYLAISFFICCCVAVIVGIAGAYFFRSKGYRNVLSQRKKCFFLLSFVVVGIFIYSLYYESQKGIRALKINEICSCNELTAINANGEISDYIELYNSGYMSNSLNDIFLSDDYNDLKKLKIPYARIAPKEFVVIPLNNESISLNKFGGDTIYLSDSAGYILDSITLCELAYNQSYARVEDGDGIWDVVSCSPGMTNIDAELFSDAYVTPPELSNPSGFYAEEFELMITSNDGNAVYYTLDGSEPNKENGTRYQKPLLIKNVSKNPNVLSACEEFSANNYYIPEVPIDKGTIIKARAYDENNNYSDIVTALYFVDEEDNRLSEKYCTNIPVFSLIAESDDLIGYDKGILVLGKLFDEYLASFENEIVPEEQLEDYLVGANFNQKGRVWEREAVLSFFENGKLQMQQKVGIRRRGKGSSVGAQKGFNIFARSFYSGTSFLDYDVFHSGILADRITLKYARCLLKDGFIMDLLTDRDLIPLYYRPVSFFLNGEYWGTYTMMERYKESFFKNHYGIDNVTIFCNGGINEGNPNENIINLLVWATENDLSVESNYEFISQEVDLQSFIDYYCVRIYMDDIDSSETYNMMAWKPEYNEDNIYADGKWHWAIYDIDATLNDYKRNNLTEEIRENRPGFLEHSFIKALLENEKFKDRFIISFTDMINYNFSSDIVLPLYEEKVNELYDVLQYNNIRFYGEGIDENTFEDEKEFFINRSEYVLRYLRQTFELDEPVTMQIFSNNGTSKVRINTSNIEIDENARDIVYFPDIKIQLSVSSEAEEYFSRWIIREGNTEFISTELTISVEPKEGTEIILVNK